MGGCCKWAGSSSWWIATRLPLTGCDPSARHWMRGWIAPRRGRGCTAVNAHGPTSRSSLIIAYLSCIAEVMIAAEGATPEHLNTSCFCIRDSAVHADQQKRCLEL